MQSTTSTKAPRDEGSCLNRKRVVVWMTVGVAVTLFVMTFVLLGAVPPWPVWLFFALSHGFFCAMVWRVKPYRGPYHRPMPEITVPARPPQDRSNR